MDALNCNRAGGILLALAALSTVILACNGGRRRQPPDAGTGGAGGAGGLDGGGGIGGDDAGAGDVPAAEAGEDVSATEVSGETSVDLASDSPPATLVRLGGFAAGRGGLCGVGYDHVAGMVWVYPCSNASVFGHLPDGTAMATLDAPGEAADDVDVDVAPAALTLGTTAVPAGSVLFINGETDAVDLYALDQGAMSLRGMLAAQFGNSHVVGGAYHNTRSSFFAVQDKVPGATIGNLIAEIDPVTGAVKSMFSVRPSYDVNYGDLDVCQSTGNLFVVSDTENTIGEFTPAGVFVQGHPLPAGVSGLSGIGIDDATGDAWVSARSGTVSRLDGLPCM